MTAVPYARLKKRRKRKMRRRQLLYPAGRKWKRSAIASDDPGGQKAAYTSQGGAYALECSYVDACELRKEKRTQNSKRGAEGSRREKKRMSA